MGGYVEIVGCFLRGLQSLKVPNMELRGPNYYTYNGVWGLIPSYLGTRALKAWLVIGVSRHP